LDVFFIFLLDAYFGGIYFLPIYSLATATSRLAGILVSYESGGAREFWKKHSSSDQ